MGGAVKYLKYLWMAIIVMTVFIRSYGYEPSYINREIKIDAPKRIVVSEVTVQQVYDPLDQIYYTLDEFNHLSQEQLIHFKGIGESTANSILDYIQKNDGLHSFNELTEIKGIGDKKLEGILENSK